MTNMAKLKGKIVENSMTIEKLAKDMNIDVSTLYRRLQNEGMTFTIAEATEIVKILRLTSSEALSIFFGDDVA